MDCVPAPAVLAKYALFPFAAWQMAYQPVLDAIDQMDTGFELPSGALKAAAEHRQYYNTYLQQQRQVQSCRVERCRLFSVSVVVVFAVLGTRGEERGEAPQRQG